MTLEEEQLLKGLRYLNADISACIGNNDDDSLICPIYSDKELLEIFNKGTEGCTHYDEFIKKEQNND